jgi:hypothetical protein
MSLLDMSMLLLMMMPHLDRLLRRVVLKMNCSGRTFLKPMPSRRLLLAAPNPFPLFLILTMTMPLEFLTLVLATVIVVSEFQFQVFALLMEMNLKKMPRVPALVMVEANLRVLWLMMIWTT